LDKTKKEKIRYPDEPAPLLRHLDELRKGLVYSAAAIFICSIAAYSKVNLIIEDIARPVGKLYFLSPFEAFWCQIQIAFFLGFFLSLPVVLFQLWNFIQKGLLPKEKRSVLLITIISFLLFASGASFCYFLILPVGVKFLLSTGSDVVIPMLSISRYLFFVVGMVFSFGMVFELPLVIGFMVKAGFLKAQTLIKQWRFCVVIIFIAAAVLTPGPDIFSQLLMAGPLLILYAVSIIIAKTIERRR
jgi:sec-independent protein translocase protein TatC